MVTNDTPIEMGVNETFTMTFSGPGLNASDIITNEVKAGNYLGIALDLGRISKEQILSLKARMEATKNKIEAQDITNLTREDILGDLLYSTALSYYADLDVMDYLSSRAIATRAIRLPSEGIFASELAVQSFFGIPMSVRPGGLVMDVDRAMSLVKALDGSTDKPKQLMLASGINASALEHLVPEQFFSTPENPSQGISAVKALKIANDQGIPIYTINQGNINVILPQLQLDSGTITDIQNAVNAGKEVVASKTDITLNGWTGCGYIIIDSNTGAGAYMISGGVSGGWLILLWVILAVVSLLLTIIFPGFLPLILISIWTTVMQIGLSSWTKYELGWNDWEITTQQGLTGILDIIVQITLGALSHNMLPPGIASEIIYVFKTIAASVADWIIFFFTRHKTSDMHWAFIKGDTKRCV